MLAAALLSLGSGLPIARAQAPAAVDPATLRSRAEAGEPDALNALANVFANGSGVPQNLTEAVRLYELAAAKGHAPALFNLGMMSELGRGLPADLGAAFKRYLRAAELGFAPAQFNVGNMYANGLGVKADFFEAALWFRQAADRAIPEAQYNLALAYELGRGVAKDEAAAQKWYRAAAEQGYSRARYNLALMLEDGRGSPPDPTAAATFYRAAAEQNFGPAQNNFGIMLAEGRGGLKSDPVEAYAWLSLAAENGAKPTARDLLVRQLSSAQIAAATTRTGFLRAQLDPNAASMAAAPAAPAAEPALVLMVAPPARAAVPAGPDPQVAAALENARNENARLLAENTRLTAATQAAQTERRALDQRLAAATAEASRAAAALAAAETAAKNAAARSASPDPSALAALQATLAAAQTAADLAKAENTRLLAENARLGAAAAALQQEKTALDVRLAAAAKPAASIPADAALRAQVDQLQRDAVAVRAEKDAALRQVSELAAQLKAARETSAAATLSGDPAASGASDSRLRSLADDNVRLNSEVKRATVELTSLSRQLRQAQERLAKLGAPAAGAAASPVAVDAENKLAELTRTVGELRSANEKLTADNQRLATQPASPPAPDLAPQLTAARARLEQLTVEKAALEKRVAELSARPAAPAGDSAPLMKLRGDLAETQSKLVAARLETEQIRLKLDETADTLAARTARFTRDLEAAKATVPAAAGTEALVAAQRAAEDAKSDLAAATAASDRLARDLSGVRNQLASQTARQTALTTENQRLLAAMQAAQADRAAMAQLQTRLAEAERATARQTATAAELATTKEALATARAEGQVRGVDQDTLNKLNAQLDSAGKTIADLSSKNDELVKDLEVSKQSVAAALAAQASAAKAAPDALAMRVEMQTLQEQVTNLESRLETERGVAAKELSSVALQLQSTRETNRALTEANRALIGAKGSDDSALRTERDQLDARVRELTSSGARLAEDKAAAERATAEARKSAGAVAQERDTLRGQVDDMFSKLTESERGLTQFKQGADTDRGQIASAQSAAEQARAALAALQAKFNESEKAVDQQGASVAELTGVNDRLSRERSALASQLTAAQTAAERVRAELADLKSRHEAEIKATGQQSATLAALIAADEKSTATLAALSAQVATLRTENSRLAQAGDELAKLRTESADVRRKLAESDQAGEQHAATVAELTGTNEKITAERRDLLARVETLSGDLSHQRELVNRLTQSGQSSDAARREAEQRANQLAAAAEQLNAAQRELGSLRSEHARLRESSTANERERSARMAQLQQENAAITLRLRQAQGTLDQIASAARLINGTVGASAVGTAVPVRSAPATVTIAAASAERFHLVQEGDSLTRISARYYGTPNRWQDIYEANRDVLRGENALRPGQRLRIP